MPSSCAILVNAATVPLYGTIAPALTPWVYKTKQKAVVDRNPGIYWDHISWNIMLGMTTEYKRPKKFTIFKSMLAKDGSLASWMYLITYKIAQTF